MTARRARWLAFIVWTLGLGTAWTLTEGWAETVAVLAATFAGSWSALLHRRADGLRDFPYRWTCDVCGVRIRSPHPDVVATWVDRHKEAHRA